MRRNPKRNYYEVPNRFEDREDKPQIFPPVGSSRATLLCELIKGENVRYSGYKPSREVTDLKARGWPVEDVGIGNDWREVRLNSMRVHKDIRSDLHWFINDHEKELQSKLLLQALLKKFMNREGGQNRCG